ncbi:unnamed protein product [Taenia asiatica]|uniref:R3H-assoc domain-containing protein n=1 Tax=Taenia asiatica TaxID=60517 RepID=A0A0R3VUS2_TAEAS|nr:unnamed protein product [Taenia asiatica]
MRWSLLRIQSLTHYSDFDGTSESETSELSIVLPSASRFRSKKQSQPAEGQIRQRKGARAIRRYENDAYLNTLAMITEASGEDEIDDYWIDKAVEDTGFKCLFVDTEQPRRSITGAVKVCNRWEIQQKYKQENHLFGSSSSSIREVWDAFISLSETEQIELLGSLASHSDFSNDDVDMGNDMATHPPPRNYNNANRNNSGGRQRRRNKGRSRRRPVVHLEPISEDPMETSLDALSEVLIFDPLSSPRSGLTFKLGFLTLEASHDVEDSLVSLITDLPFPQDVGSDDAALATPGSISPKLLELIRTAVGHHQRQQQDSVGSRVGVKGGRKKQRSFCVQDLCLIQRVETELRRAFGVVGSPIRVWTPSTSLLRSSIPPDEKHQGRTWVRGLPLALSGFQRMLVHATANYLGLHSFSEREESLLRSAAFAGTWDESLSERQLWVDRRGAEFRPPRQPLLAVIRTTIESMLSENS